MITLTSCLLVCLISAKKCVAASSPSPPEAWPPKNLWPSLPAGWRPPGAPPEQKTQGSVKVLGPKALRPLWLSNTNNADPSKDSKTHDQGVKPKTFSMHFQAPTSNTDDGGHGHGHDHYQYQSHSGSSGKHSQDASKPGFHFSLSIPFPPTTAPPSPTKNVIVNAGFLYSGASVTQKPQQSKFVSFFQDILNPKGQSNQNVQTNTQTQQGQVFKPQYVSVGGAYSGQSPNNAWMGHVHLGGSTDTGKGAQTPIHQVVQNTMHHHPRWYHGHKSLTDYVKNDVLQSLQYVNGQLMIPLEKCPGFEYLAAVLKGQHGHVHHHGSIYHGHPHHHGSVFHSHQHQHPLPSHGHAHHHGSISHGHFHHHRYPSRVHHHGQSSRDQMQTKPGYAGFYLNVQGTAQSPTESQDTNVQLSGAYHEKPSKWWQDSSGHWHPTPPQEKYMVQVGANVEYDKRPETSHPGHLPYWMPRGRP